MNLTHQGDKLTKLTYIRTTESLLPLRETFSHRSKIAAQAEMEDSSTVNSEAQKKGRRRSGYGPFKVNASEFLPPPTARKLAIYFELSQTTIDCITNAENPGLTLLEKLEENSIISKENIDDFVKGMNDVGAHASASEISEEFSKIRILPGSEVHGSGYGPFKVNASEFLPPPTARKLAIYFELSQTTIDCITNAENPGLTLLEKLEENSIISKENIDDFVKGMNDVGAHASASEISKEFSKIRILPGSEVHDMYPYLTKQEYQMNKTKGADVLKVFNSCKETEYEEKMTNYSLKDHYQLETFSQDCGNLHIAILGKTGDGKSSTGNTILGREIFQTSSSANSVTKASSDDTCTLHNRSVTVVDTPGVHDTETDPLAIEREIFRWSFLLRHGVHCFIICMSATDHRFTEETKEMLELIKPKEESGFFNYCMLVYTNVEGPLHQRSLDDFIEEKKKYEPYKCFIDAINGRVVAVNNMTQIPAEQRRNREVIVAMADKIVRENKERGEKELYSNEIIEKAGNLHNKIASVADKKCHPIIVNAAVEAFFDQYKEMKELDVFQEKVLAVLLKRPKCTLDDAKTLKFNYNCSEVVMRRDAHEKQIKLLFDELKTEFKTFLDLLKKLSLPLHAIKHVATKFYAAMGFRGQSYSL